MVYTDNHLIKKIISESKKIKNNKEKLFEYTIKTAPKIIDGEGCTVFIFNSKTKRLEVAASNGLAPKDWPNAVYEEGEGFTGWVFKYGIPLYIPDETDEDYINKIEPTPPEHAGQKRGKPCETEAIGPFLAEPIHIGRYVVGVIRIARAKGDKKSFTKKERELFHFFAENLSGVIDERTFQEVIEYVESKPVSSPVRKLITTYREIEQTRNREELLKIIVKNIPDIINASHCTIFLIEDETDNIEKFHIKATSSKTIQNFIGRYFYVEGEGFTGTVAKVGKSLVLSDLNNPDKELNKWKIQNEVEADFHIKHKGDLCEIPNAGPFIAVPIKISNKVIGILRVVRKKGKNPFDKLDLDLLESFSNQLGLTLERVEKIEELEEIKKNRISKINFIFSNQLLEYCKNLQKFSFSKEIGDFIKSINTRFDEDIEASILSSLKILWDSEGRKYNFTLFKDFKDYEEYLYELPHYRDHFIHQYQVFLLGAYIINKLNDLTTKNGTGDNFASLYFKSLKLNDSTDPSLADTAWLITSTFHDIAYPIEKIDQILEKFFSKFMNIKEIVVDKFHFEPTICGDYQYLRYIDQLSDYYNYLKLEKKEFQWEYKTSANFNININEDFRKFFLANFMQKRDHGILSSLILLNQNENDNEDFSSIIFPSSLAIALHNKLLSDLEHDVVFEKNPLTFLLIYCDLVHEWGRDHAQITFSDIDKPSLQNIDIFIDDDSKINIKAVIKIQKTQVDFKKAELGKAFRRLKSENFRFIIKIEDYNPEFSSETIF